MKTCRDAALKFDEVIVAPAGIDENAMTLDPQEASCGSLGVDSESL